MKPKKVTLLLVLLMIALPVRDALAKTKVSVSVKPGTSMGVSWVTDNKLGKTTFTDSDNDGKITIVLPDGVKEYSTCKVDPVTMRRVYAMHTLCLPGGSMNSYVPYSMPTLAWAGGDDLVAVWNVDGFLCVSAQNPFTTGLVFNATGGVTALSTYVVFKDGSSLSTLPPQNAAAQLLDPVALAGLPNFTGPVTVANDDFFDPDVPSSRAGFGSIVFESLDVESSTAVPLNLGVQELNGSLWISGTAATGPGGGPYTVWELDCSGNVVSQFSQTLTSTGFGYRDGATDGVSLFWACEDGIYGLDTAGVLISTVQAANGPQTLLANPITGPGLTLLGTYRGLAFDPNGNAGNGSFWTGDFGDPLIEIDLAGNILTQHPQPAAPDNWSIYGLARDPNSNTIWINSSPNTGDIVQVDLATGLPTGARIQRAHPGTPQGGMCGVVGPAAACVSDLSNPQFSLIALDQAGPDRIAGYRVHLYSSVDGPAEPRLVTEVSGGGFSSDTKVWTGGSSLSWGFDISSNPGLAGSPDIIVATFSPAPAPNGYTLGIPEFHPRNPVSCPSGAALILGDGFGVGPFFGIPLPVSVNNLGAPPATIFMPPTLPFNTGDTLRMQALYLHPASPFGGFMSSNEARLVYQSPGFTSITVSADGGDSFNATVASGFFQIDHAGFNPNKSILKVVFDWTNAASVNPANATMEFDVDQGGMADAFWNGNSAGAVCQGTYRLGSDAATGLIYGDTTINGVGTGWTTFGQNAAAGQLPLTCGGDCGFIATNQVGATPDYKTIEWNYTAGSFMNQTFHVDVDTDQGAGISGDQMDGLEVTITLQNGTTVSGFLTVDPAAPQRSSITFNP